MSMAPDVWDWRGRGDSCGAASLNTQMLAGRNAVGGPSTRGAVWGSTQTALPSSLLAHSRSWEDLPCCPVENTKEVFKSHLGWRSSQGKCLCSELHLCFTVTKIRQGSWLQQLQGLEFPKLPDRVQITFEKRLCQFSLLLAIERSSLLKWCFHSQRLCSPILPQVPILQELPWHKGSDCSPL